MMATAVKVSSFYIICLSKEYKERPNCRSEGQMIRIKQNLNRLVIFVMMDSTFTEEVYDCWLGSMVAGQLWYPLWDPSQVSSTAEAIIKLINGKDATDLTTSIAISTTPSSSPTKQSTTTISQSKPADYELAWSILSQPKNIGLLSSFTAVTEDFGIGSAEDLSQLEPSVLAFLPFLCKLTAKKKIMDALGLS